ncbi:beta-aspartyl-peptidase [Granulosicoccus antarcticus]|uniref:beta-aspartyl-peptidase n=1 Tax=Granulosicoccus antarcticus TaxID=437505 RepID=UPI000B5A36F4|nr:beta-aspartyl-peptidase [Granulosicoccus antarcticus]
MKLITNAHVYAPDDIGIQHILVAAGKILWMGASLPSFNGVPVEQVDLQGQRVLPGFIDGHAHLTGGGGESGFKSRVPSVPLSHFTSAGVTSVVGVLGTDDTTRDTRSLVAHAYALREEGLSAWCHTGGYHLPPVTITGKVRDDIVFIDPIIGVGEIALSDHRSSQPTLPDLLRLASDAHVAGLISGKAGIIHLHLGDGMRGLELVRQALDTSELPARVFNPTHVNRRKALFDEALELAGRGCTIDITAFPVADDEDAWRADTALIKYLESGHPDTNVTISSDGGGCLPTWNEQGEMVHMDVGHPSSLFETLQALLAQSVPLERALPAFTSNVADILRLPHKGRIAPNNDADLIVINDQNAISDVMAGGNWHVSNQKQCIHGTFENTTATNKS